MEYLQYSFLSYNIIYLFFVLNLVISGIPSILYETIKKRMVNIQCFKPYYKWNTFNTSIKWECFIGTWCCFKPYYNWNTFNTLIRKPETWNQKRVLNLIIIGIPSILVLKDYLILELSSFKPYYNWNTFNTPSYRIRYGFIEF